VNKRSSSWLSLSRKQGVLGEGKEDHLVIELKEQLK
jgi:hypothetical protein